MCYSNHRIVNEPDSFHNKLKTTYLDGSQQKGWLSTGYPYQNGKGSILWVYVQDPDATDKS